MWGLMHMKDVILIAGSDHTRLFLQNQLNEYIGNVANIKSYATDYGMDINMSGDLIVFSSRVVFDEMNFKPAGIPYIIGTRTINYSNLDKLFFVPEGTEVLFVNDAKDATFSCIENLICLEINHLRYYPYYPEIEYYKKCTIAVTAGETDKVPKEVKTVINLGSRPFDMGTLVEIMHKLGCYDESISDISSKYVKKIIELGKRLSIKNNEVVTLDKDLERIIADLSSFQNKKIIKETTQVKQDNNYEDFQKVRHKLLKKRYYAKYSFDDIAGNSKVITELKETAKKLARTDLSILIDGESGTGKELFASAVHNYSKRKYEPFLAVNFSAIPENLVESELFGYEDGAFTGAKKGGKIGYFEQADGGTIFLDEIGDASLTVQARLLRVLQEKEIMRIGGDRIIPLDIRIIASTNKDLLKLSSEGKFRLDLYYRLKMGYLHVPPLRDRDGDAKVIASHYIKSNTNLKISSEVFKVLDKNPWNGNVRELINTFEYAAAMCEGEEIKVEHLPPDINSEAKIPHKLNDDNIKIMNEIYEAQKNGKLIGRKSLCEHLNKYGYSFSEQSMRTKLEYLEGRGMIIKGKGKIGTRLTDEGINLLKNTH
jgi:DNA-binding NtrC family response regulator